MGKLKQYANIVNNPCLRNNIKSMNKERKRKFDFFILITGYERFGKCCQKGSKVLMANGEWKNIEDIVIGDYVLSPQKDESYIFAKVKNLTNWWCDNVYDVYELNKKHKKLYSCSYNHSFPINRRYLPTINRKRSSQNKKWNVHHYTAERYSKLSPSSKTNMTTLTAFPIIKFKDRKNCIIEPYTLGFYLGDGSFCGRSLNITTADICIIDEISKYYSITKMYCKRGIAKKYSFSAIGKLGKQLTSLGLEEKRSGVKFIPKQALLSDLEYRKRLLAGLIDSDGYYVRGSYSITTKSEQLAKDIIYLVHTLGGRGSVTKVRKGIKKLNFVGTYYAVQFYMGQLKLPLQIKRKIRGDLSTFYLSSNRVSIDVKQSKPCQVYGFEIEGDSKWYITDNFIITHNSTMGLQICKQANPNFSIDDVSFSLEQFAKNIDKVNKKAQVDKSFFPVLLYDEAGQGLYNRLTSRDESLAVALLNTILMQIGFLRGLFVLILPNFFVLDNYVREHRVTSLIHVYKRGSFLAFGKGKVERISSYGQRGKQIPRFIHPDFRGTFTKYNPLGRKYLNAELKYKQGNISESVNRILGAFKNIKNRIVCPKCDSLTVRYRRKEDKYCCERCGNLFKK